MLNHSMGTLTVISKLRKVNCVDPCLLTYFAQEATSRMHDPLSTSSIAAFGGVEQDDIPPWPTTPHYPGSTIPNLLRPSSVPPTPEKGPAPGIYGKDPQIYGQPELGLVSPQDTIASNGVKYEKPEPYLRVRINGLDRNRRDILVKLDAQVRIFFFHF